MNYTSFSTFLIALALAFESAFMSDVHAQAPAQREVPIVRFECVVLGTFQVPKLYFIKPAESGRKPMPAPVEVSVESRGTVNLVPAPDGHITLYSSPACDAASIAQEIPVNPKEPSILQLLYLDTSGSMRSLIVKEAPDHGPGQIRIINVSGGAGGIRVDSTQLAVNSGEDKILPIKLPTSKFFSYKAGWATADKTFYETGGKNLFFPAAGLRMTVVLANVPSVREKSDGKPETVYSPQDYRFYDRVPENVAGTPAHNTP